MGQLNISILHFSSEHPPPSPQSLTINPGSTKTSPRSLGKKISIPTISQAQPPGRNPHPKYYFLRLKKCKKRNTLPSLFSWFVSFFPQSYLPANQTLHMHTRTQSLVDHMWQWVSPHAEQNRKTRPRSLKRPQQVSQSYASGRPA